MRAQSFWSQILEGAQSLREPNLFDAQSLLELNPQEILSFEGVQSLRDPNPQEAFNSFGAHFLL